MIASKSTYQRGDIVLPSFSFTEESGTKQRPTLILNTDVYMKTRQEIIIAAITSNIGRILPGDYLIQNWKAAGLVYPSVVTGIIRTVKQSMIQRRLGSLTKADFQSVEHNLRTIFGL